MGKTKIQLSSKLSSRLWPARLHDNRWKANQPNSFVVVSNAYRIPSLWRDSLHGNDFCSSWKDYLVDMLTFHLSAKIERHFVWVVIHSCKFQPWLATVFAQNCAFTHSVFRRRHLHLLVDGALWSFSVLYGCMMLFWCFVHCSFSFVIVCQPPCWQKLGLWHSKRKMYTLNWIC